MKILVLLALLLGGKEAPVKIRLTSTVILAGQSTMVICTVPRHPDNRTVTATLPNYTSSEHQLDGEDAAITHRFLFVKIPCDVEEAMCVLKDKYNLFAVAKAKLEVAGCEP